MTSYNKLDSTDNFDFGLDTENNAPFDGDDIFITPDTQSSQPAQTSTPLPKLTTVAPTPVTNKTSNSNSNAGFNFSSFITPQIPDFVQIETRERPFTGGNTLDESVLTTLHRDLATIGDKVYSILWPMRLKNSLIAVKKMSGLHVGDVEDSITGGGDVGSAIDEYSSETMRKIRDWDLWGPLVINLLISLVITYMQSRDLEDNSSSSTFSAAFTLIWASLAILTVNIQLLSPVQQKLENGGMSDGVIGLSFFQCVSLLSYAMFPILLGGVISIFVPFRLIKMIINLAMLAWSLLCTWLIIAIVSNCKKRGNFATIVGDGEDSNEGDKRIFLMVYPVFLVFGIFSWFFVIV